MRGSSVKQSAACFRELFGEWLLCICAYCSVECHWMFSRRSKVREECATAPSFVFVLCALEKKLLPYVNRGDHKSPLVRTCSSHHSSSSRRFMGWNSLIEPDSSGLYTHTCGCDLDLRALLISQRKARHGPWQDDGAPSGLLADADEQEREKKKKERVSPSSCLPDNAEGKKKGHRYSMQVALHSTGGGLLRQLAILHASQGARIPQHKNIFQKRRKALQRIALKSLAGVIGTQKCIKHVSFCSLWRRDVFIHYITFPFLPSHVWFCSHLRCRTLQNLRILLYSLILWFLNRKTPKAYFKRGSCFFNAKVFLYSVMKFSRHKRVWLLAAHPETWGKLPQRISETWSRGVFSPNFVTRQKYSTLYIRNAYQKLRLASIWI